VVFDPVQEQIHAGFRHLKRFGKFISDWNVDDEYRRGAVGNDNRALGSTEDL
jgi:hypothetical protein